MTLLCVIPHTSQGVPTPSSHCTRQKRTGWMRDGIDRDITRDLAIDTEPVRYAIRNPSYERSGRASRMASGPPEVYGSLYPVCSSTPLYTTKRECVFLHLHVPLQACHSERKRGISSEKAETNRTRTALSRCFCQT